MNRPSSTTSHPLSTSLLITKQRDRSWAAISWGKLLLGQWQSLLFYFITNVLRFEHFSTREKGDGAGCKVTGGENRTHTTKTCYIQIHVIVCASWRTRILFEASVARSLSFSRTHAPTHTNVLPLAPLLFFFFFLNSREQSIRRPREKIHSKIVITYSNVQYRNNRELFNKHRQMFRCLYEFLFPFVFFVSIQRIYIGLLLSFGNVSMKAFVFLKRRFTEGVEINEKGGWKEQKETFFYVTFDLVLNLDILSDRKIHKGTRHDQTSF